MTLIKCPCGATIEFYTIYKGVEHSLRCSYCGKINKYKFKVERYENV